MMEQAKEQPHVPPLTKADWVTLFDQPLPTADAIHFVHDPSAGGIAVFLGTTRHETGPASQPLIALDYEAYPEMAIPQLHTLAAAARSQWPIIKLALLHRSGRVPLGQPSVLIAVSTPHRDEAFTACRFMIDTLKRDVAIWKKEVWADGSGTWVHPEDRGEGSGLSKR
jgi:molybdopterin synthase catalytic subunit